MVGLAAVLASRALALMAQEEPVEFTMSGALPAEMPRVGLVALTQAVFPPRVYMEVAQGAVQEDGDGNLTMTPVGVS